MDSKTSRGIAISVNRILGYYDMSTEEGHFMSALRAEIQRRGLETCQNTKSKKLKPIRDAIQDLKGKKQMTGNPLDRLKTGSIK